MTFYQIKKWPYFSVIDTRYRARLLASVPNRNTLLYLIEIFVNQKTGENMMT